MAMMRLIGGKQNMNAGYECRDCKVSAVEPYCSESIGWLWHSQFFQLLIHNFMFPTSL